MRSTNLHAHSEPPAAAPSPLEAAEPFRRILVPVDFNPATHHAIAQAVQFRRRFGSTVSLFRFAELDETSRFLAGTGADSVSTDALIEAEELRVLRLVEHILPGRNYELDVRANVGVDVVDAIVSEARRVDATLVVVGAEPGKHLFRTPVERLVQRLSCPVLVVRGSSSG